MSGCCCLRSLLGGSDVPPASGLGRQQLCGWGTRGEGLMRGGMGEWQPTAWHVVWAARLRERHWDCVVVVESWGVRKWVRDRVKEGYERKNLNPRGAGCCCWPQRTRRPLCSGSRSLWHAGQAWEGVQTGTASPPEVRCWVLKQTLLHSHTQCAQSLGLYVMGSTEDCDSARWWVGGRKPRY